MTDLEYKEYTSEDGEFILRTLKHDCKRESCNTCKEGSLSYMMSHKDEDLWINMAVVSEEDNTDETRHDCLNGDLQSRDDHYRLSFIIGYGWEKVIEDEDRILAAQVKAMALIRLDPVRIMVIKEASITYLKEHRRLTDKIVQMERENRIDAEESLLDALTAVFTAAANELQEDKVNWQSAG